MGGAPKGAPSHTYQETRAELPKYVRPFFERMIGRAEMESLQPYQPWTGPSVAEFSPIEQMAHRGFEDMYRGGERPELQFARDRAQYAAQQAESTPYWGAEAAEAYMNPYQQAVTDIELERARGDAATRMRGDRAAEVQGGGFGGSRSAIAQLGRETNLEDRLSEIQARGSDRSWAQAQQQFGADRQARQAAAQMGMEAGREAAGIGSAGQQAAIQRLQGLMPIGAIQRELSQQQIDAAKRQFITARDYPRQNLAFLAGALRGIPTPSMDAMQTSGGAGPSSAGQAIGAGLGTLGMLGALKGFT